MTDDDGGNGNRFPELGPVRPILAMLPRRCVILWGRLISASGACAGGPEWISGKASIADFLGLASPGSLRRFRIRYPDLPIYQDADGIVGRGCAWMAPLSQLVFWLRRHQHHRFRSLMGPGGSALLDQIKIKAREEGA